MPGIDFALVRASVPMRQVLDWIGFDPSEKSGSQWRGPCPVHGSKGPDSRSFSVNIAKHRFKCFRCNAFGNQIELWAAVKGLTIYAAAIDLCQRANLSVPWITR